MAEERRHTPSNEDLEPVRPRQVRSSRPRHAAHAKGTQGQRRAAARSPQGREVGEGQRRPQRKAQRPPAAHAQGASQARDARAPQRRSSAIPIAIAAVVLVAVGILAFVAIRSCAAPKVDNAQQQSAGDNNATAEQGQAAAQTEQSATPAGATDINLLMVGDMLFHYQVRMSGLADDGTRNYDHLFAHVLDELKDKDIKVINQETPIAGPIFTGSAPDGYDGYPEFNGPQEVGDAEAKAGFNVVLKATNHAMDHSGSFDDPYTLVKSEREFWKTKHPEVAVIGQADPTDENSSVEDVYVYEKNGFKVALLNYTLDLNGNEVHDTQGIVSMLEEEHVRSTMAKAHEMADMVVVFPHWGEEYSLEPVEMQMEWAKVFVDAGADVIIGNHPHVMEPATVLAGQNGKAVPCYWSTGNFVSTSPSDESLMGAMVEVTLRKAADGTCSVESATLVPMVTHLGLTTDMTTYLLRDWTDELASTNAINTEVNPDTDNTSLTVEKANALCEQLFGSDFDIDKSLVTLDLTKPQAIGGDATADSESQTSADATAGTTSDSATTTDSASASGNAATDSTATTTGNTATDSAATTTTDTTAAANNTAAAA